MITHHEITLGRPSPSYEARTTLAGLRVFVAEDEPILLWALEDVLDVFGCTLAGSARSVKEALSFVAGNTFDVAVLDGTLVDGCISPVIEVLTAQRVPFVLASGNSASEFAKNCTDAVFVRKPYSDVKLREALLAALAR